jgi:uncharacterized membrane protein
VPDDNPVDLYIAAYSDPDAAGRDWADLKQLEEDEMIKLDGLVLVSRDADGKIHVRENTHDVRRGSILGAVGGLVVGLIFPPALLASGLVGAGLGAGAGGLISHHEKNEIKADVEDVLPPGSSGIVAVFEERWGDGVDRALMNADSVKKEKIDRESAERIKAAGGSKEPTHAQ